MNLTSFDYYSDRADPKVGLTRTASLIRQARREAEWEGALVLLFDNGDALQGGPLGDCAAANSGANHPLLHAFTALSYDAVGLGNHDFGFGLPFLDEVIKSAPYPVISSNAHRVSGDQLWKSCAILQRDLDWNGDPVPVKIGVISVLPPQTEMWEAHLLTGRVKTSDILDAAREQVKTLRALGCDLVVALSHSGLGQAQAAPGLENAAIPLAAIPGIDAIIAGHTHLTLPGDTHRDLEHTDGANGLIHGKPAIMPGWAGSHLGQIDLTMEHCDTAGWRVVGAKPCLHPIAPIENERAYPVPEDPEIRGLLADCHSATRQVMAQPIARVEQPIHSYFSYCIADRGMGLVAAAQADALRPFLPELGLDGLPLLSATPPCKFGGRAGPEYYTNVPAGGISLRHLADMHVFPNTLCAVVATGAQLRDWLEMSACIYNQLSTDRPMHLTDSARTGYNFDVIFGVTYQIDLSQPARFDTLGQLVNPSSQRIRNLSFEGRAVTDDQTFVVALNNYRANGGGHFPISQGARRLDLPTVNIRDCLQNFVIAQGDSTQKHPDCLPFSFAPLNGAQAILRTGPDARRFLAELTTFAPTDLGIDKDGFLELLLTL